MMNSFFPEPETPPLRSPSEAAEAWRRIYADQEPAEVLAPLCRQLALGIILFDDVRIAVEKTLAGELPPIPGFITRLADLIHRVRITPLLYLAEFDDEAAVFLARHPHVIATLLAEQGPVDDDLETGLTVRARNDAPSFLRKMKVISPLLLEHAEIDRRWVEHFLEFVHRPITLARLKKAESVRDALGVILADFCREHGIRREDEAKRYVTRNTIDNILWQVAVKLVRRVADASYHEVLDTISDRLRSGHGIQSGNATLQFALAEFEQDNQEQAERLLVAVTSEYQALQ